MLTYIIFGIAASIFTYCIIYKPEIIACLFFTILIADINFDVAGISFRGMVGILIFLRTLVPEPGYKYPAILRTDASYIYFLLLYTILVTVSYDLATAQFIKITGQVFIAVFCGYYYFIKKGDYSLLKISLMIAGLICLADLAYTYAVVGTFPVQRIYQTLLKIPQEVDENGDFIEVINHNFYGQVCAMCFVFLLHEFIVKRKGGQLLAIYLPLMFLGVLMSTSRSSLLGLIGISIILLTQMFKSKGGAALAGKILLLGFGTIALSILAFLFLQDTLNLRSDFVYRISLRLIDEPIAVLNKKLGLNYNAQALDAMDWRQEASADAFGAYLNLKPLEQIFGIGFWGFVVRNLGHNNLPPHNGFLLLLIESGITGLLVYLGLTLSIIRRSWKYIKGGSPSVTVIIFILIYCIGQNGELTSGSTFLFFITAISEMTYLSLNHKVKLRAA
jgi:O-antigen ligase